VMFCGCDQLNILFNELFLLVLLL